MKLIPTPKKIEFYEDFLDSNSVRLVSDISDKRILFAIEGLPLSGEGTSLEISYQDQKSSSYEIEITREKITVKAPGAVGAFYAIQTLRQIFKNEVIPCCHIIDEPDFECRGFYHDVTRGKIPKVETIKKLIDDMAYYKLNCLQLYVEHTFDFVEYQGIKERTGYLTADEIREIDEYCNLNFIEFIPSLSTFGHLYELLQKDEYKHLQEIENFENKEFYWEDRMMHHTIDPTNNESFELITSLIDQYISNFSSDKFNICCDETFDLKSGKHKNCDTGALYFDFVTKIVKYLQDKGKTVMMWADIVLNYPEQIDSVPEGVQLLNWYYWDKPDENSFRVIQKSGKTQIVCPGTGSWNRLCEDYETEIKNISQMAELGYKHGAYGLINTNWGDWGNPCSIELAMFGLVLGAEKAWSVSTPIDEKYIENVNHLLYENSNACEYVKRISKISDNISWKELAKCYANILCGQIYDIEFPKEEVIKDAVKKCQNLIEEIKHDKWKNDRYRDQMLLALEGLIVISELLAVNVGYKIIRHSSTKEWLQKYCTYWQKDNKESELAEIKKMFCVIEENIKRV